MNKNLHNLIKSQIDAYIKLIPLYERYCELLKNFLTHVVGGYSSEYMIESRTITLTSFVDKISDLEINYLNNIEDISNLSEICILLPNLNELNTVCELIEKFFLIIVKNTINKGNIVYIIQLDPELNLYKRLELNIPDEIFELKAEIQIRTFLQHGLVINQHAKFYRSGFKIPNLYINELNRILVLIETADDSLNTLMKKMRDYESSYGVYMSNEKIKDEIKRLELVYVADMYNFDIPQKIAKLFMAIEDWDKAIEILENILKIDEWKKEADLKQSLLLRDLGISLCKKNKNNPQSQGFLSGQSHLNMAIKKNPKDSDAYASLGGSYKIIKDYQKAYKYYKKALEVNPGDPYPLVNYLIMKIKRTGNLKHIKFNQEMIQKGIKRRLNQIEVGVDFPWAFFDMGTISLLLNKLDESLIYYLNGINFSPHMWMIDTTLNTLDEIKNVHNQIHGIDLVRKLLLLGMLFHPYKNQSYDQNMYDKALSNINDCMEIKENNLKEPIVIIAGGTEEHSKKNLKNFKKNLIEGFKDFKGTIISGGTKSGICEIVGDIQEKYPNRIKIFGYIPSLLPYNVEIDKRYKKIYSTKGTYFSILEALQYWYDILKSEIDQNNVKLIGVNGGKISALEFRMAIAFGAQVGIIENSGRSASELIQDKKWIERGFNNNQGKSKRLLKIIKNSSEAIHDFLIKPFITDPNIENIRKLLIQHTDGRDIFEIDFSHISLSGDLLSGLLSAIQSFAKEIGFGEVPVLSAKYGSITMTPFSTGDFRVFFLLWEKPTPSLAMKIEEFTKLCEKELGDDFRSKCEFKMYGDKKRISEILVKVFSQEISKLLENI